MLTDKFKAVSAHKSVRNISWLGVAELVQKVLRIATAIILARIFSPTDYGLMSAIYTVFELVNSLILPTEISQKIIHTKQKELITIANTVYWLSLILGSVLFVIQWFAAEGIALFYQSDRLIMPLRVLGLVYLMFPVYLVQSALIEREHKLQIKAWCFVARAIASSLILIVLSIDGYGVWAVVWGIVLSYLLAIIIGWQYHSWRPSLEFNLAQWRRLVKINFSSLGLNLLVHIRRHLDCLIVVRFLGIEALGIYFFALTIGSGIIKTVIDGLSLIWQANYLKTWRNSEQLKVRYFNSLKTIALIIIPLVILQVSLTNFYLPIIFGDKWILTIPMAIAFSLTAIPTAIDTATSKFLCSIDRLKLDLYGNLLIFIILLISLPIAVTHGMIWVALTVLIIQSLLMPTFAVAVVRHSFKVS